MSVPAQPISRRAAITLGASALALTVTGCVDEARAPEPSGPPRLEDLLVKHGDLGLIDAHNHDTADGLPPQHRLWDRNRIAGVVLFGNVSEPRSVYDDRRTWEWYRNRPDFFIPFFSGFDPYDRGHLNVVRENFEQGFFGAGEIAAASSHSPVVAKAPWKAAHPMHGFLPEVYEVCGKYRAPILLHIDPPDGYPIVMLEEALDAFPETTFIFAHMNAYNSAAAVDALLERHENLYADFFAGFTELNPDSYDPLDAYVPIAERFHNRFLVSSDSGFGLKSEEAAIRSMYRFIDLLGPETAKAVAHDNVTRLVRSQPATERQLAVIAELRGDDFHAPRSKWEAGMLLAAS